MSSAAAGPRTRVGNHEMGKMLGNDNFTKVKVKFVRNVQTGDNVAIKILDKKQVLYHKMVELIIGRSREHAKENGDALHAGTSFMQCYSEERNWRLCDSI